MKRYGKSEDRLRPGERTCRMCNDLIVEDEIAYEGLCSGCYQPETRLPVKTRTNTMSCESCGSRLETDSERINGMCSACVASVDRRMAQPIEYKWKAEYVKGEKPATTKREYVYCEQCKSVHDPAEGQYCAVCVLVALGQKVSRTGVEEMSLELIRNKLLGGMFRVEMERIVQNWRTKSRIGGSYGEPKPSLASRTNDEALAERNPAESLEEFKCITCNRLFRLVYNWPLTTECPDCRVSRIANDPRYMDPGFRKPEVATPFGSCSICKVAFKRTTAKADIDGTLYCFPCYDELRRTGTVALYRRPVAPELYPEPPAVKLVEMRPKRLIRFED